MSNVEHMTSSGNWIFVEREKWSPEGRGGLVLPETKGTKSLWWKILSIGPSVRPNSVEVGDRIIGINFQSLVNTDHATAEDKEGFEHRDLACIHEGHILLRMSAGKWLELRDRVTKTRAAR